MPLHLQAACLSVLTTGIAHLLEEAELSGGVALIIAGECPLMCSACSMLFWKSQTSWHVFNRFVLKTNFSMGRLAICVEVYLVFIKLITCFIDVDVKDLFMLMRVVGVHLLLFILRHALHCLGQTVMYERAIGSRSEWYPYFQVTKQYYFRIVYATYYCWCRLANKLMIVTSKQQLPHEIPWF